ncbi:uncharacterized protein HGUI_01675 [Hanseniaspora guilliermondii]|uniref:Uncharacterized protein n=1 Tax=Hanseniaspora guilliermondii TaxID=56406 RepID=A0A1L0B3E8_9ASCO|nr:uncharacterized protein HGUI_01675 [Hanseniaspora guilliermondii]
MTYNNSSNFNKQLKNIVKYGTTIATASYLIYKVYESFYDHEEEDKVTDIDIDEEVLELNQFDELIKSINNPLLHEIKEIKKDIKSNDDDQIKMNLWKKLSEKTIVLLLNLVLTRKVLNTIIKNNKVTSNHKKTIIYTYFKNLPKLQVQFLNNVIKLKEDDESESIIMKELTYTEFLNFIKQNILDQNIDNLGMFLNFNSKVMQESLIDLEADDISNNEIKALQKDIIHILYDDNEAEYDELVDYLEDFDNETEMQDQIIKGKFAMFITILIKKIEHVINM